MIYNKDENLANLLKDKTVAYVGPSPHLMGLNNGELINSHDVVCTISYPTPPERQRHYGRTDIMVGTLNHLHLKNLKKYMEQFPEQYRNLKYIICPKKEVDRDGFNIKQGIHEINIYNIPIHLIGDDYANHIDETIGDETNTGLSGIIALLNYEIKELYITGLTFYNMGRGGSIGSGKVYYKEYADKALEAGHHPDKSDWHGQEKQIKYFVDLLKKEPRITFDPWLEKHFWLYSQKIL